MPRSAASGPDSAAREKPNAVSVQSISRAVDLLTVIAAHPQGITLSEVSKQLGLHNSTAFHLLKTLQAMGYVQQSRHRKLYRIGRSLFAVAVAALREEDIEAFVRPELDALSRDTGESSHFAIRTNDTATILARVDADGPIQLVIRSGIVRPLHCTAIGKIILASMSDREIDRFLSTNPLTAMTDRTIRTEAVLRREIDAIRESGVAFDDVEFAPDIRCVAVPVRDFAGRTVGALGISGPIWRLSIQMLQERMESVKRRALSISEKLGAPRADMARERVAGAGENA